MAGGGARLFKIGEVARRTGFSRQQLHNFLTMGLMKEDSRTASGHRLFGAGVFRRLAIIRGLLRQYPLAELRRTWKAFLHVVLAGVLLLSAAAWSAPSAAAAERAVRPRLSAEDVAAVRKLFEALCRAMREGRTDAVTALLDPELSRGRQGQIGEQLDADFESRSYTEFGYAFDEKTDLEAQEGGRARAVVLINFKYYERAQGSLPEGDEQRWEFELARSPAGVWRIADSQFFDTLSATQSRIFESVFLWAAIILVVGCFWGWMFLDCCFRSLSGRKLPWVLAVGLLPGLGALVYFFAVWMRQGPED